jgi:predicted phosphohydrolase
MSQSIQVCSDIHLDYRDIHETQFPQIISKSAEILVLAGDIGNPFTKVFYKFIQYCSGIFQLVLFVPGNHESFGTNVENSNMQLTKMFSMFSNVILLNNSTYEIGNIVFIGSTLWSNIPTHVNKNDLRKINDFSRIKNHTIEKHNSYFQTSYDFINNELLQLVEKNKKVIIITHHSPSFSTIADKYIGSVTNCCYVTDLDHLLDHPNLVCWIYGHLHDNRIMRKKEVILYSNCFRAEGYNNKGTLQV